MKDKMDKTLWKKVKFGNYVEHVSDRVIPNREDSATYIGLEHMERDITEVRRWGTDIDLIGTKLRIKKGDVLLARRNPYLRRVQRSPHGGIFSAHGMVLRSKSVELNQEFLLRFMQSELFWDGLDRIAVGSLSKTINWGDIAKYEFLLPPIQQQLEIVQLLLDFENSTRSLLMLDKSLNDLLNQTIQVEIARCDSFKLLPEVAKVLDSQRVPINSSERNLRQGDVPYYGAGGQVGWIDHAIFDEDLVLVGEDATLDVYRIYGRSWVNNHAHVLRPTSLSQDWLYYVLSRMNLKSIATNGTRLKLTQAALNSIEIPIPTNEASALDNIRVVERSIAANLDVIKSEKLLLSRIRFALFGGKI